LKFCVYFIDYQSAGPIYSPQFESLPCIDFMAYASDLIIFLKVAHFKAFFVTITYDINWTAAA